MIFYGSHLIDSYPSRGRKSTCGSYSKIYYKQIEHSSATNARKVIHLDKSQELLYEQVRVCILSLDSMKNNPVDTLSQESIIEIPSSLEWRQQH